MGLPRGKVTDFHRLSRGGAVGHTGGTVSPASVLVAPCKALALVLPQEQTFWSSSAPLFIYPFLLTLGPAETRFRKLSRRKQALLRWATFVKAKGFQQWGKCERQRNANTNNLKLNK